MIESLSFDLFGVEIILSVIILAFICELVNAVFGGGHGTLLAPLLLIAGYHPLEVIPPILLVEFVSGLFLGLAHHKVGNVSFRLKSKHLKIAITLGICSLVGAILAVFLAISIPTFLMELYVGSIVLLMGIVILLTTNKHFKFSWKKILGLGIFAAFNKGLTGGGYGPLLTGGQLLTGANSKEAVSITPVAKSITCLVGFIAYAFTIEGMRWYLTPSLLIGSLISVPITAFVVKKVYEKSLRILIGVVTTVLGIATLVKILFFQL